MAKIFTMQNYTPDASLPDVQNIIMSPCNGTVSEPIVFLVLLGIPPLIGLVLLNYPSSSVEDCQVPGEKKRS